MPFTNLLKIYHLILQCELLANDPENANIEQLATINRGLAGIKKTLQRIK